jgi:hypothetical protein
MFSSPDQSRSLRRQPRPTVPLTFAGLGLRETLIAPFNVLQTP